MYVTPSQQAAARLILKIRNGRAESDTPFLTAVAHARRSTSNSKHDPRGERAETAQTEA